MYIACSPPIICGLFVFSSVPESPIVTALGSSSETIAYLVPSIVPLSTFNFPSLSIVILSDFIVPLPIIFNVPFSSTLIGFTVFVTVKPLVSIVTFLSVIANESSFGTSFTTLIVSPDTAALNASSNVS